MFVAITYDLFLLAVSTWRSYDPFERKFIAFFVKNITPRICARIVIRVFPDGNF